MTNWDSICLDSIRREKGEIAKRYGIRFGQTEIYCVRCGRPIANPLNHTCEAIQLRKWREAKGKAEKALKRSKKTPKGERPLFQDEFEEIRVPSDCREVLQGF